MGLKHLLKGACLGAGAMYFLDPQRGRRRRALLRDQAIGASHYLACHWDKSVRDLNNRLSGFVAEFERWGREEHVSDNQLAGRVRSKLGRYVSNPRAIEVSVDDGRVTLRGPVLASEIQAAFDAVRSVPGVGHVENELEAHAEPGNLSALQGGQRRWEETRVGAQPTWPPAASLGAAAGGLALMLFGIPRLTSLTGLVTGLGLAMSLAGEPRGSRRGCTSQLRRAKRDAPGQMADDTPQTLGPSAPPHEQRRGDAVPMPGTVGLASSPSISMSPPQPARFPPPIHRGVDS